MGFLDNLSTKLDEDGTLAVGAAVFLLACICMCGMYYMSSLCGTCNGRQRHVQPPTDIEVNLLHSLNQPTIV